ncbi:DNA-directed RNA polymerase [Vibrio fortis]|uniref:DNA-directed RNA polymerase n=1 Tax=Vibrio fortis TaxID=212667 RepID=A0A5N3QTF0_9VIBR|nr:DNA-directed RNA polymerase [Vibrio fortis]KAB0285439.1 DNA-directed RNA polymerase [Vibrio fortis]
MKKKMDTFLKLTPAAAARINNQAEASIAAATCRLPMVTKPVTWTRGMTDGGAYLTSYSPLSLFKTRNRDLLDELRGTEHPEFIHFLDGHNVASQTGHCIDVWMLDFLKLLVGRKDRQYAKLPSFTELDLPCPLSDSDIEMVEILLARRPEHMSNNEYVETLDYHLQGTVRVFLSWRKDRMKARQKAVEQAGAQSNLLRTIEIAESLRHYTSIFFPTQSDDRGRVYYATPLLNPQGADHEKALILFDTAKEIGATGWDWLRINVSNLMGNDKANYADRIAYVEANREMIESCIKNPLKDSRWEGTDKPFQFLQAARELVEAWSMDDPTKFKSRVGIACDASCSGLQILGTLTRCESSMKFTNCLPAERDADGNEFMQDIYGEAARIAGNIMRKVAEGKREARNNKDDEQFKLDQENAKKMLEWSYAMKNETDFTRNWLKRNTMTFFYGSAKFGMRQQLLDDHLAIQYNKAIDIVGEFGDVTGVGFPWANMKDAGEAASVAGNVNYDAICAMADRPSKVMASLQRYAELIAKSGKKMRWTTPLGLLVEQRYEKTEKYKIDSMITGKRRMQTTTQRPTGEVDANGQKNGAAPNWVHSLDASLLLRALSEGQKKHGLNHWRIVHDSFAVHAADTAVMVQHLKDTMADMLDKDLLKRTAEELEAQIDPEFHDQIIPFPELGDEALVDQLRKAEYPFC